MVSDDLAGSFGDPNNNWADAVDADGNPLVDVMNSPIKLTFDYDQLNGNQKADKEGRATSSGTFYNLDIVGVCSSQNNTYSTSRIFRYHQTSGVEKGSGAGSTAEQQWKQRQNSNSSNTNTTSGTNTNSSTGTGTIRTEPQIVAVQEPIQTEPQIVAVPAPIQTEPRPAAALEPILVRRAIREPVELRVTPAVRAASRAVPPAVPVPPQVKTQSVRQ
ncbi:MAG: hypothetical protein V8Q40_04770 [Anaerosacchariphilus sp.]